MSEQVDLESFGIRSYRYLRMAIVVVVVALFVSVAVERSRAECWQESISAYFYTPVHSVFVAALVVIGVSLVAIRGGTDLEDALLNVAGVLAPIVAFVPTARPTRSCSPATFQVAGGGAVEAFIENNVLAFAIGGTVALALAVGIAWRRGELREGDGFTESTAIGLAVASVLVFAGVAWYGWFRASFLRHAHGGGAIVMFLLVFVVIVVSARAAGGGYRRLYRLTAGTMVAGAVAVAVAGRLDDSWRHQILWIEVLELVPFGVFWAVQTVEYWNGGVVTGAARAERNACIPGMARRAS